MQLQNRLEALLEEAHIKLSSLVSDLLGVSARRMLQALAEGETNPAAMAALADGRLRATPEQLRDALGACQGLKPTYRRLLKMALDDLNLIEKQIGQLDPGDGRSAPSLSGPSPSSGRGTRPGCGFSAADHCRSGRDGWDLSFRGTPLLMGRRLPRRQ